MVQYNEQNVGGYRQRANASCGYVGAEAKAATTVV